MKQMIKRKAGWSVDSLHIFFLANNIHVCICTYKYVDIIEYALSKENSNCFFFIS